MTQSINNQPPNPDPQKPNAIKRLWRRLKPSPKQATIGIAAIATCGVLGYWGIQYLVKQKLPPFLETQIGNFIDRPIDLGEVKGFSLSGIEFGKTVIPSTATDSDRVEVDGLKVGFNLIPVIFRRTLPLEISLIQPDVYLEQERDGEWINLDFLQSDQPKEDKEPWIYFDVAVDIEDGDITAVPFEQSPIEVQVDGSGRYSQAGEQLVAYDLDATVAEATANIEGETLLETGKTDTKLLVEDLALSDVATFVPNLPVTLDTGILNADLDVNIPSWEEITAANVKGNVSLQNLSGQVTPLSSPVTAQSQLDFTGREGEVKETQATLGDIVAQVDGKVNLDTGYDLDARVLPFRLSSLPPTIKQQLPVNVAGEVGAQLQLQGEIKEPVLTGTIDNTETITVDKTQFREVQADFKADLTKVVLQELELIPVAGGEVTATGVIETKFKEAQANNQPLDVNEMPLAFDFTANLPTQKLVTLYYQLPSAVAVGDLDATGKIGGTIGAPEATVNWNLAEIDSSNYPEDIAGSGKIVFANQNLNLQDTQVTVGDGKLDVAAIANLDNKSWQADIEADSLYLTPFIEQFSNENLNLNRPIALEDGNFQFSGKIDNFDANNIQGEADLQLDVNGSDVAVNSQLNSGNITAQATTNRIALNPFINNLPVSAAINSSQIDVSGKLNPLLESANNPDFSKLQANANAQLDVDGNDVRVSSQLNSGNLQGNIKTNEINLNKIVTALPVGAKLKSSNTNFSGELEQLLEFQENPNLSTVKATVDADLIVAEGTVQALAGLNNNQWQTQIDANNLNSALLLAQFAPDNYKSLNVDNLNAQANITGDINPLINNQVNVPINIQRAAVQSGEQKVSVTGDLTLSNITTNLDVANTNLDIDANIDFDRLPIDQIIAQTSNNNQQIAQNVNIAGKAAFDGQFQGKNLISAPSNPENLSLTGNLQLLDFAFNEIDFDPVMGGEVNVQPNKEIALNLEGEQDIIAARAVPCTESNCRLPYLPTDLELRQGEDTNQPVIATGNSQGDNFSLDIVNFPLALLNLTPAKGAGIEGALAGKTTGELNVDLYTFAANGGITVNEPGIGYIEADKITADFNYNPAQNIAEVTSASLDLKNSKYNANAALNLATGAIDGQLTIPEAYIQDILTTLRWFTIQDVTTLFNIPDYASAAAVKPSPEKDLVDNSIARKLNQLRIAENKIQANAKAKETTSMPNQLDIEGKYSGEITFGGTIDNPQADFEVTGNNWQWQPQTAYVNVVQPLGLIKEASQFISIPQLIIKGDLQGTTVDLDKASIQVEDAILSLAGKLSPEQEDATFQVKNLTVDTISNFVNIPVDVAGGIDAAGTIKGSPSQPQIAGNITFSDGAFNGRVLPTTIAGDFAYGGEKLDFQTTAPESIKVDATVPYPIIPGKSDRLTADVQLETEAFNLLGVFSQNYLNWLGGEGNAEIQAEGLLDLEREGVLYDLNAQGVVNLEDARVNLETPFFSELFQGTGKITLNNQIINIETLEGTFADKDLSVTGKFPILTAVNNLENPLTVDIPEGKIDIDKLYEGKVAGNVQVTGSALQPVIGGKVRLEDGTVSIPETEQQPQDTVQLVKNKPNTVASQPINTKANTSKAQNNPTQAGFVTALDNFQVELDDFALKQTPLYDVSVTGDLTLNGTVDQPSNIKPEGTLMLTEADVDLLSSNFTLTRSRENTIVFTPAAGTLNPYLDIQLQTEVSDVENVRIAESGSNEINDPLSQGNTGDTINVFLVINGEAKEILPNLQQTPTNCRIRPNNSPLVEASRTYSEQELNRLTNCFNEIALVNNSDYNILNSSAVELNSIPSRSQGELISLFGDQFLSFAEQLGNSSQAELFELGFNRFVVTPIVRKVFYRVDDVVVNAGKKVGLDYFRLYPNLEGIYEINRDSTLRSSYNYVFNEIRLEYELRF